MLKYQTKIEEYGITSLDHKHLADSFRQRAKEFVAKIEAKELTEEEIAKEDQALLDLFNDLHNTKEEDSEELKKIKLENLMLKGKEAVSKTDDPEELEKLKAEYKDSEEVIAVIDHKIARIKAYRATAAEVDQAQTIEDLESLKVKCSKYPELLKKIGKKISNVEALSALELAEREINEPSLDIAGLNKLKKKYSEDPALVKKIDESIQKIKDDASTAESNKKKSLRDKLLSQEEWSFKELRTLGIDVTGDDMTVEGIFLERQYLLNIYIAKKPK
jgi:hypothetical protein